MASETSNPTGTPSFALRKLVREEISKSKGGSLHNQIFITNPSKTDTQILGPAFFNLPLKFTLCYPVLEESKLIKDQALNFVNWTKKNFVCWPIKDKKWDEWTISILKHKKEELEQTGLLYVISMLRDGIQQNPALIHATLAFWDPLFNYFRFNCGMIAPTVLDVVFLTGLPPFGPQFDISKFIDEPLKDMKTTGTHSSYGNFLEAERKYEDEISEREFKSGYHRNQH